MPARRARISGLVALPVAVAICLSGCDVLPAPTGLPTPPEPTEAWTGPPVDSTPPPDVTPVIVIAGLDVDGRHVTVSAYVAGLVESGGTCSYDFIGPGPTVSVESSSEADRSTTACGSTQVESSRFSKGTWEVTMTYTGLAGDTWSSEPLTMEVA
jgi:hypothetical protein